MANRTKVTAIKKEQFLDALLASAGNVSHACRAVDLARRTIYEHRDLDSDFAQAWDDVIQQVADTMEREAYRRAVEGVNKPVFQQGREVGSIREYSDTLLIFMLKGARPDKYRESAGNVNLHITPEQLANMSDAEFNDLYNKITRTR